MTKIECLYADTLWPQKTAPAHTSSRISKPIMPHLTAKNMTMLGDSLLKVISSLSFKAIVCEASDSR